MDKLIFSLAFLAIESKVSCFPLARERFERMLNTSLFEMSTPTRLKRSGYYQTYEIYSSQISFNYSLA